MKLLHGNLGLSKYYFNENAQTNGIEKYQQL